MTEEEQAVWRERGRCFNRFLVNIAGKKKLCRYQFKVSHYNRGKWMARKFGLSCIVVNLVLCHVNRDLPCGKPLFGGVY